MAVIDANWSVANVSTVWHERHSRVQAAACQGHNRPSDQWVSKDAVCRSTHGKSPPPASGEPTGHLRGRSSWHRPWGARSPPARSDPSTHWPSCAHTHTPEGGGSPRSASCFLPSAPQASPKRPGVLCRRPRKFGGRRRAERGREQSQAGAKAGD